jgi:hypothetical protein
LRHVVAAEIASMSGRRIDAGLSRSTKELVALLEEKVGTGLQLGGGLPAFVYFEFGLEGGIG